MSEKRKSKIIVIGNPTNKSFIEDLIKKDINYGESFVIASHSDSGKDASKITFEAIDPDRIMSNNLPEVIFRSTPLDSVRGHIFNEYMKGEEKKGHIKPDYGFKHCPWLVPDFIGVDVQKEIAIMKSASCGKTETLSEALSYDFGKRKQEKINNYMNYLKERYGR